MQTETPKCKSWKIWTGPEVEGTADRGVFTLFIREIPDLNFFDPIDLKMGRLSRILKNVAFNRVWFCKEFRDWDVIRKIADLAVTVVLEAVPGEIIPQDLRLKIRVYWKIPEILPRKGDFICIGPPYFDEAFEIGTGTKVDAKEYASDQQIL